MDMAANDYVREIMVVCNPATKFAPTSADLLNLKVDGQTAKIRPVVGLPQTDYYEPFEHA
jgi:hypothetical protein